MKMTAVWTTNCAPVVLKTPQPATAAQQQQGGRRAGGGLASDSRLSPGRRRYVHASPWVVWHSHARHARIREDRPRSSSLPQKRELPVTPSRGGPVRRAASAPANSFVVQKHWRAAALRLRLELDGAAGWAVPRPSFDRRRRCRCDPRRGPSLAYAAFEADSAEAIRRRKVSGTAAPGSVGDARRNVRASSVQGTDRSSRLWERSARQTKATATLMLFKKKDEWARPRPIDVIAALPTAWWRRRRWRGARAAFHPGGRARVVPAAVRRRLASCEE